MEQESKMLRRFEILYVGLAIGGIGIAIYQTWEYLTQNFSSCTVQNSILSCGGVASWAALHPLSVGPVTIPYWSTGLVWFPLAIVAGLLAFRYELESVLMLFLMIGNLFTVYLWYLELGVIHLICPVCVSLYVVNYALTGVVLWAIILQRS
jgi:uncharacterized membrane protein